jgi:hypothetical protein
MRGVQGSLHSAIENKMVNVVASSDHAHGRNRKIERE